MTLTAKEIAWVIRQHGENDDPFLSARIGEAVFQRQQRRGMFKSTLEFSDFITEAKEGKDMRNQHPAKLVFQAIRTWINQEFFEFEKVLQGAFERLKYGGRCVVICFKRQETMMLNRFVSGHEEPDPDIVGNWSPEKLFELYPL